MRLNDGAGGTVDEKADMCYIVDVITVALTVLMSVLSEEVFK